MRCLWRISWNERFCRWLIHLVFNYGSLVYRLDSFINEIYCYQCRFDGYHSSWCTMIKFNFHCEMVKWAAMLIVQHQSAASSFSSPFPSRNWTLLTWMNRIESQIELFKRWFGVAKRGCMVMKTPVGAITRNSQISRQWMGCLLAFNFYRIRVWSSSIGGHWNDSIRSNVSNTCRHLR